MSGEDTRQEEGERPTTAKSLKLMKIHIFVWTITNLIVFSSCSQNSSMLAPGYRWDLFKNTPNWDLAKAVAKQDTGEIFKIIRKGKVDLNLQESKFQRTLLMLAVGNDKVMSTTALLKMGADVKLRDLRDDQAIHEAVAHLDLKRHSLDILKLLVAYGANVNSVSSRGTNIVPLAGAVEQFSCAKFLLDNKASPYFKRESTYPVWFNLMVMDLPFDENIFVAKYMIVDKKLPIPSPIFYTSGDRKPVDILTLLIKYDVNSDPKKQKTKETIIEYLHQINFPKAQVYHK